jgi:hypothetical protein
MFFASISYYVLDICGKNDEGQEVQGSIGCIQWPGDGILDSSTASPPGNPDSVPSRSPIEGGPGMMV